MKICPDCTIHIEDSRKRCIDCAYKHHKLRTSEQRRERTTEEFGWGKNRWCKDCLAPYVVDKRYSSGYAPLRCPECQVKKYGPKPPKQCRYCTQTCKNAHFDVCDTCKPQHDATLKAAQNGRNAIKKAARRKTELMAYIPCTVCNVTMLKKGGVCSKCGAAARRREQARLRNFRDRLFQTLVHEPADVEFLINLLNSPCKYCGSTKDITIEHATPLIRGGAHDKSNLVPACFSCNSSKQAKTSEEFLASLYGQV